MSSSSQQGHKPYNNTCLRITSQPTPDPFVTYARGKFYLTFTAGNRVPLWEAERLEDFWDEGRYKKGPIWTPPPDTPHSAHLWAPELHILQGNWYVYVAAAHPQHGNRSHRMYVLRGPPASEDPHSASSWEFLGPIAGMDQKQWAIDGTVFELEGGLYFAYSGWPIERAPDDYDERTQQLFILRLHDPATAASAPVRISHPAESWERSGEAGINEGPQWLESPDGGRTWRGLVYSCAGSWTKEYKMATLRYCGGNPLDPKAWRKGERPLLQNAGRPPWGPGHGDFVRVGEETLAVFHGTEGEGDGHGGRMGWVQRVGFGGDGPWMGGAVGPVTRDVRRFERGGDEGGGAGGKHGGTGEKLKGLLHSLKNRMDG